MQPWVHLVPAEGLEFKTHKDPKSLEGSNTHKEEERIGWYHVHDIIEREKRQRDICASEGDEKHAKMAKGLIHMAQKKELTVINLQFSRFTNMARIYLIYSLFSIFFMLFLIIPLVLFLPCSLESQLPCHWLELLLLPSVVGATIATWSGGN